MKRTAVNLSTLSLALATALPALSAQAQESAPGSSAATLDAVKVTARKREETLQDVPVAVTAFTPDVLDRLNISDLGDIGAQVPNLTLYAARGSTSTITAYIRGIGQSDPLWGVDPGVGVYIDDVYVARPQGALLDVVDVERIEVLRGPQGTLYGKNTIGGAIKYITRGLPQDTTGSASVTLGNYNQWIAAGHHRVCFDHAGQLQPARCQSGHWRQSWRKRRTARTLVHCQHEPGWVW